MPRVHIDLDTSDGRRDLSHLTRMWFEMGWESLGGWLRERLHEHPLPAGDVTEDLSQGMLWKHYPSEGHPFLLLGARTGDDRTQDWNRLYSQATFEEFLSVAATVPPMAAMISGGLMRGAEPPASRPRPADPSFQMSQFRHADPLWLKLEMSAARSFLTDDRARQRDLLAFLRKFADASNPVYGECGLAHQQSYTVAADHVVPRGDDSYRMGRSVLRSFSWLTLLPQDLIATLGGTPRLRATGAFAEVEELKNGGLWLLACERLEDFDSSTARRVFEVLEPVLPPGLRAAYPKFEASIVGP